MSTAGVDGEGMVSVDRRRADATGIAMYLIAAFLFALNGVVAKSIILAGIDPAHFTAFRNLGAMVLLLVIILVLNPRSLKVTRQQIPFLILYGVVAFTLVQYGYFVTITRLNVGFGTLLCFLAPVMVALWLRFARHQGSGRGIWIALTLSLLGLVLIAQLWEGITFDVIGVASGLGTAVALSLYWMLGEKGRKQRDAMSLTFWGFAFASVAWAIITPWWTFPWSVLGGGQASFPPVDSAAVTASTLPVWPLAIGCVVLGAVTPFLLVVGSLDRIGSQRAGIVATTEPIWATLLAMVLLAEPVGPLQLAGGMIVIAGIIVAEVSSRSRASAT
jgi:drug/metabolite transporter (DMT)-like permease